MCVSLCVSDFTPQAGVQSTSQAAMATRLAPLLLPHGKSTQAHEHTLSHWSYRHKAVSVTHTAGRVGNFRLITQDSVQRG